MKSIACLHLKLLHSIHQILNLMIEIIALLLNTICHVMISHHHFLNNLYLPLCFFHCSILFNLLSSFYSFFCPFRCFLLSFSFLKTFFLSLFLIILKNFMFFFILLLILIHSSSLQYYLKFVLSAVHSVKEHDRFVLFVLLLPIINLVCKI